MSINKLPHNKLMRYFGQYPKKFDSLLPSSVQQAERYSASRNNLGQKKAKIIHFGLLVVFICSLIGLFRQISIYSYTNRKLAEKEYEIRELEEKNQALKVRFEEVQSPKFLEEQARKLLGMESLKKEVLPEPTFVPEPVSLVNEEKIEPPNFQKWLGLFFH